MHGKDNHACNVSTLRNGDPFLAHAREPQAPHPYLSARATYVHEILHARKSPHSADHGQQALPKAVLWHAHACKHARRPPSLTHLLTPFPRILLVNRTSSYFCHARQRDALHSGQDAQGDSTFDFRLRNGASWQTTGQDARRRWCAVPPCVIASFAWRDGGTARASGDGRPCRWITCSPCQKGRQRLCLRKRENPQYCFGDAVPISSHVDILKRSVP